MIDLTDTTFVIPIMVESQDRADNLKIIVDYLSSNFKTNIIVNEQNTNVVRDILKGYDFKYLRQERLDGFIHRTKQINDMVKIANTQVVANYDADVLLKKELYKQSQDLILQDEADFVLPYKGFFYEVPKSLHKTVLETKSIDQLNGPIIPTTTPSVGGVIFFNRGKFIQGGMENENFISWGFEDNERIYRFDKLGYRITRIGDRGLMHLKHKRTINSSGANKFYRLNQAELAKLMKMDKNDILKEISSWEWLKNVV